MLKETLLDLYLSRRVETTSVEIKKIWCEIDKIYSAISNNYQDEILELEALYNAVNACDIADAIWFGFSMGVKANEEIEDVKKHLPKLCDEIKSDS